MAKTFEIHHEYDGNLVSRELRNGGIIERPMGWRYVVVVDGVVITDCDLLREATAYIRREYGEAAVAAIVRYPKGRRALQPPARRVCAWCQTVLAAGAEPVTHGICEACAERLENDR